MNWLDFFFTMSDRIFSTGVTIIGLLWIISLVQATQDFSGLPTGPYCARYNFGRCCPGRKDDCSAPILGTTCYCDDFCNRTREDDCCPDYWSHCKGITLPTDLPSFPEEFVRNWQTTNRKFFFFFIQFIELYILLKNKNK